MAEIVYPPIVRTALGLFKLLTFPVSMPLSGGRWVLQTLLDEAERRYYDEAAIRQEMAELERQLTTGEIGDPDWQNHKTWDDTSDNSMRVPKKKKGKGKANQEDMDDGQGFSTWIGEMLSAEPTLS